MTATEEADADIYMAVLFPVTYRAQSTLAYDDDDDRCALSFTAHRLHLPQLACS